MTEQELQQYLIKQYPKEDESCVWKEFKNLKNDFSGHEKDDVISYVSALSMLTKCQTLCEKEQIRDINENKIKMFFDSKNN